MGQVHSVELGEDRLAVALGLTTYSAPLWKETQARLPSCCGIAFRSRLR